MKKNILVTGAGAVLGQGILRSLQKMQNDDIVVHSADPDFRSTGHWLAHKAHQIPLANHYDYIKTLKRIIIEEEIDVVFIGTDTELPLVSANKQYLETDCNAKVIVSNTKVIDIANDKAKTALFLKQSGFEYPDSVMACNTEDARYFRERVPFPYFAKPVDGARSKGIMVINSDDEFEKIIAYPQNLVLQEYLPDDEGEFTSGCLVTQNVCRAVVTLRRDLRDGNTYRAYYEKKFSKYNDFIAKVAEKLQVYGPCNFQFRLKNGVPVIFEINARFSGTTPIRFMFGFNEVEAVLNNVLKGVAIQQPSLKEGMVLRAWSDLFITKEEVKRMDGQCTTELPRAIFHPFYIQ